MRIIRKVPELMEIFVPSTRSMLTERNHGESELGHGLHFCELLSVLQVLFSPLTLCVSELRVLKPNIFNINI